SALHHGLTDLGREVVHEMNRIGMIVDISHVSDETLEAVLTTSTVPVMASHSSCRALSNMPRNLTDEQIKAIAARGGVVMINIGSAFLDQEVSDQFLRDRDAIKADYMAVKEKLAGDPRAQAKATSEVMKRIPKHKTTWTKVVDHIDHVIKIAGPDAVGLGTDF